MNLCALTPELASKISGFSQRFRLGLATLKLPDKLEGLIVLGDGTPDDWVVFIISHHLNGSKTIGIVKPPETTGTSTFNLIRIYLTNIALKTIVFFVDQEVSSAPELSKELERTLAKQNITSNLNNQVGERFKVYDCSIGQRQFKLALVINGMDAISSKKHTIEDHLLLSAAQLKLIDLPETIENPKFHWHNTLSDEKKESVFKELIRHKKLIETIFPQQNKGCGCLKP